MSVTGTYDCTSHTAAENENVVRKICGECRKAKVRLDIRRHQNMVSEPEGGISDDARLVYYVERCLLECARETQLIIRNEFMNESRRDWYIPYFSRTTYYRLRPKAVQEFLEALNI